MKFDSYHFAKPITTNLQQLGYKKPTDIQYRCIPPILRGEDVLAIAQTGTGKTAAFVIPVLQRLFLHPNLNNKTLLKCLVMVPTHELAIQITEVFEKLAYNTGIRTLSIVGGTEQAPQIDALKKGVDILVATPGRLFDLTAQGFIQLSKIEILILDEADHMLDLGFITDIRHLIKKIPAKRQTLFFSATINEHIKDLAYSIVLRPVRIQLSPKDPVSKNVDHSVVFIEMDDKRFFLERVINEHNESKILVFVRTKVRAERVLLALERVGIKSETIHGDKDQQHRRAVMENFKTGTNKILIATDVSARGIDIPNVEYVVNYDLPDEPENYVHRIGRTGRGTKRGTALSFCSTGEKEMLENIQNYIDKPITIVKIDKTDYSEIIDLSAENKYDWKALIKEANKYESAKKKKKFNK